MTSATSRVQAWWQASSLSAWMGWRLRALAVVVLLGGLGVYALWHTLAIAPHLDIALRRAARAPGVELRASGHAELQGHLHRLVRSIEGTGDRHLEVDSALLRSPRWIVGDEERHRSQAQQAALSDLLRSPSLVLIFDDGSAVRVAPTVRGWVGLGVLFWLISAMSLVLCLIGAVVLISRPGLKSLLYAVMGWCQGFNLLWIAIESAPGLGLPVGFAEVGTVLRTGADLFTGAAVLHACLVHPHALRRGGWLAGAGWAVALAYVVHASLGTATNAWWWTQSLLIGCGVLTLAVLTWSHRHEPHPASLVLRRLSVAATGTLALLTLAVALADRQTQAHQAHVAIGSMIWYVFFASLLLLVPFMSRAQHVMREFAMLAGLGSVATSLDLLFIAVLGLGQFASLTLALFVSLGVYAGARHWTLGHLAGTGAMTAEQTFDSLYRAARAIEATPLQAHDHLARLLLEMFEPLEIRHAQRIAAESTLAANGSMLVVPLPMLPGTTMHSEGALILRYARRGRRLFAVEDAHLADRVLEQLRGAVAYDRAVEHGRNEERARLAQDLHDDIGARLLTLMYKAPDPEMEEYLRHTLQDLKTLTRGLAVRDHLLSEAAVEWKADIAQRLAASHCDLTWVFQADRDVVLGVVHWSGLTRILRELVNNVIAHAGAAHVDISATFARGELNLSVSDDGTGHAPQSWSHGLGLGGVRKRAKLLGGQVRWREREPHGIVCEVHIPRLGDTQK